MSKFNKKYFKVVLMLISSSLIVIVIFYLNHTWNFKGEINKGVCIKQAFGRDKFDLVSCSSNLLFVPDVEGWIVKERIIYGSYEKNSYFSYDFSNNNVVLYENISGINKALDDYSYSKYDFNEEENVFHLRYGAGKNRKY